MDYGTLNKYFDGVAAKRLAAVDVDPKKSNQHEFNGVSVLRSLFGDDDIKDMPARFVYLTDDADPLFDSGLMTWYDARRNIPNRTEYRLYYKDNAVIEQAREGDLMVVALTGRGEVLVAITRAESNMASQVCWLFGLDGATTSFALSQADEARVGSLAADLLECMGVKIDLPIAADAYLDGLIETFGNHFPRSAEFSRYAAETLGELDWHSHPDESLLACYEREEMLFRLFERYLVAGELEPFIRTDDIDGILRIAMSTFQRRKSRAGSAFENQLRMLFDARRISYSAQSYTEGKSKPDFIFPSIEAYHDTAFPVEALTMLGAKTTIKERWRQVLDEADRIAEKHLITLEPAVSEAYTKAMQKDHLQLVVPRPLFATFTAVQQHWLMDVADFCALVEGKQNKVC
ncbi:type II restriction endonuclease [Collinsella intestinalis]|uniref:type II restriction endonuclease n=1 Tax=Collinsella intestinalis TaxID=147207 RepID=UPI0025A350D6|nr:type II restriction endonuclease [Collinsella intestinalis]MDM8162751.1 type II restriction endonuclease [Collinsella intestinalis]